jgi:hypothetical protein
MGIISSNKEAHEKSNFILIMGLSGMGMSEIFCLLGQFVQSLEKRIISKEI